MQNIFLDTEFTSLDQRAVLLSIALIDENGRIFYAESDEYSKNDISPWVQKNVIENFILRGDKVAGNSFNYLGNKDIIKRKLEEWFNFYPLEGQPSIRVWADVPHWDWVLFCELFGSAFNIPPCIHYMPMDIATALYVRGINIDMPRIKLVERKLLPKGLKPHNALYDAQLIRLIHKKYIKS